MLTAVGLVFWFNHLYVITANETGGVAPPEARLLMAMVGGVLLPVGVSTALSALVTILIAFGISSSFGLRK